MYKSVDIDGESYRPSFHYNALHYITLVDPSLALSQITLITSHYFYGCLALKSVLNSRKEATKIPRLRASVSYYLSLLTDERYVRDDSCLSTRAGRRAHILVRVRDTGR